jgi:assimilatory nitrate reductase catalytic subunit
LITPRQRPGSVFAPMHWTDQFASNARIDSLITGTTDPISGQPELKAMPVAVERFTAAWFGFAVARTRPVQMSADYWALAPAAQGWRAELAGLAVPEDWQAWCAALLGLDSEAKHEMLAYHDKSSGQHRFAVFDGPHLIGALYVAPAPVAVARGTIADTLRHGTPEPRDRLRMLAGRPGAAERDRGAIVCACFDIGVNQIADAITKGGCLSVAAVGQALSAGTNCGSCRPEIGRIVHAYATAQSA